MADDPLWDVSAIDAAEGSSSSSNIDISEHRRLIGAHARTVPPNYRAPVRHDESRSVGSSASSSDAGSCRQTSRGSSRADNFALKNVTSTVNAIRLRCRFHGIGTQVLATQKVPDVVCVPPRLLNAIQDTYSPRSTGSAEVLLRFKLVVVRALPAVRAGIAGSDLKTPYLQLAYAGTADAQLTPIGNTADLYSYISQQPPYPTLEVRLIDAAPDRSAARSSIIHNGRARQARATGCGKHVPLLEQSWHRVNNGFRRKLNRKSAHCYCCKERFHEISANGAAHAAYTEYYVKGVRHATMVYHEPPAHIGAGRCSAMKLNVIGIRNMHYIKM